MASESTAAEQVRLLEEHAQRFGEARERARFLFDRGQAARRSGAHDVALAAFGLARESATLPETVGDCHLEEAGVHADRGDCDAEIAALEDALRCFAAAADDTGLTKQLDTTIHAAHRHAARGCVDRGLELLDSVTAELFDVVDDSYDRPASAPPAEYEVVLARAELLTMCGRYEAASVTLAAIGATGNALFDAYVASRQGGVHAGARRWRDAAECFERAVAAYEAMLSDAAGSRGDHAMRTVAEWRKSLAANVMNIGAVKGAQGLSGKAVEYYRHALSILEDDAAHRHQSRRCVLNLAVEALQGGDLRGADRWLTELRDTLPSGREYDELRAGLEMNSGVFHDRSDQPIEAQAAHVRARKLFLDNGSSEWAARSGINLGSSIARRDPDEALRELIPATIYVDSMRFQFAAPAARLAWRVGVVAATQQAFELAHGNDRLVAELIEHAINSGVHTATVGSDDGGAQAADEQPRAAEADAGSGAGRLLAVGSLPMRPPPPIRMPNGAIALRDYRARAVELYGDVPNTTDEIVEIASLPTA